MEKEATEPRLAFIGKALGESLFWLAYALFFGGIPILVYFTMPGAAVANLIVGAVFGLGLFAASIYYLGRHQAIIVYPREKRFLLVEGVFVRRRVVPHEFGQVARVECGKPDPDFVDGLPGTVVRVTLRSGEKFLLELPNPDRAKAAAEKLSKAFAP